jgi:hypothetical protein
MVAMRDGGSKRSVYRHFCARVAAGSRGGATTSGFGVAVGVAVAAGGGPDGGVTVGQVPGAGIGTKAAMCGRRGSAGR